MARLEMFIILAIAAIVASYQPPDWNNPYYDRALPIARQQIIRQEAINIWPMVQVFRQYDTDRNGELNWIELSEMFPVPRQLVKAMKLYDEDMSGTLDPQEFDKVFERYRKDNAWKQ